MSTRSGQGKPRNSRPNSQGRTIHGFDHSFRERWRRISFKLASRFLMLSKFLGWTGQHGVKFCPPVTPQRSRLASLHWPRSTKRSAGHGLSSTWSKIWTLSSSDKTRATLGGPDGWSRGWVAHGRTAPTRFERQQGGDGVMIWAGIVGWRQERPES